MLRQLTRVQALLLCLLASVFYQCQKAQIPTKSVAIDSTLVQASITKEGLLDCFEEGLAVQGGIPIWCEASAVVYDGYRLTIANDKTMPDIRSSVFYWFGWDDFQNAKPTRYRLEPAVKNASKFEDFALAPDKNMVFLSTAFDRVKDENTEWDNYNSIIYWQKDRPYLSRVLSIEEKATTSVKLREMFISTLSKNNPDYPNGIKYFKTEGLAATETHLFFGIREIGNQYNDFKYVSKILSLPYRTWRDTDSTRAAGITGYFETIADLNLQSLVDFILPANMGLSSIEYDPTRKLFWILTSYEAPTQLGAYLWVATEAELRNNKMRIVRDADNNPLFFNHKAEDLTFITPNTMLVVHDDDRMQLMVNGVQRKPHQAPYTIVTIK